MSPILETGTEREEGRLTVIVPTWNARRALGTCLEALREQSVPCSVLVIDDGSEDGSRDFVARRFPEFECLRLERNGGFAKAVNQGLKHCRTEYVALLNNDTEVDINWVREGLQALQTHSEYSFFASKIVDFNDRSRIDAAGDTYGRTGLPLKRGNGEPVGRYARNEPVLGASAGAAFYRMSLFDEIGLLDEDYFMYLEDVELSLRASLAGHKCLFLSRALVYHVEAASDPERRNGRDGDQRPSSGGVFYSGRRVFWITRNRWQLMWTYQPVRFVPWLAWGWIKSALFHLLKVGFFRDFVKGSVAGISLLPLCLRKRRRLRRTMRISKADLCRLIRAS